MANEKTVRVRMREGLVMPVPHETARNTASFVCTPETPMEVVLDRFTRRRLESGDFVLVEDAAPEVLLPDPPPLPPVDPAASMFSRTRTDKE